jgi:hypothetical protein
MTIPKSELPQELHEDGVTLGWYSVSQGSPAHVSITRPDGSQKNNVRVPKPIDPAVWARMLLRGDTL